MSTRRNVDFFLACSDMEPAAVEPDIEPTLEDLFELVDDGPTDARSVAVDRLEDVDDRITDELGDLSEVAPARELWNELRDLVRGMSSGGPVEPAARIFVAVTLLDTDCCDSLRPLFSYLAYSAPWCSPRRMADGRV